MGGGYLLRRVEADMGRVSLLPLGVLAAVAYVMTSVSPVLFTGSAWSSKSVLGVRNPELERGSLVACRMKKRDSWKEAQIKNALYLLRNPVPKLTPRALRKRLTKVELFRRQDMEDCEKFLFIDPREDKYQWSVEKTRIFLDQKATEVNEIKTKKLTSREKLNLPPPAICLYTKATERIKTASLADLQKDAADKQKTETKEVDGEGGKGKKGKAVVKPKAATVDLTNVDSEFMAFKGLVQSKKQRAAAAARQQKTKRSGR